ncbi:hypothetical protein HMPREF3033_01671 [Veillonellaceae bacterium DNF00751]|nr:hypothetical protein HMPREF3033_01671 [Veillonellaceae bacterium DNF00751]
MRLLFHRTYNILLSFTKLLSLLHYKKEAEKSHHFSYKFGQETFYLIKITVYYT